MSILKELGIKPINFILFLVSFLAIVLFAGWFVSSPNLEIPAGYCGYITQGSIFGKRSFVGIEKGPSSTGKKFMIENVNVSITPYTYTEEFSNDNSVLSKDNLKISFRIHILWKVNESMVKDLVEKYSTLNHDRNSEKVIIETYQNFLKEPLRTISRDEVQKLNGLDVKNNISLIGDNITVRIKKMAEGSPFEISSVYVGNVQYPIEVADSVARKMATTQLLEQKKTEIEIETAEKEKRIIQAEGVAKAMEIIQTKLTPMYIQHEAIEAQKAMVGSPNHTTIYIPVGAMGVPVVKTIND